jgi:hypothetical protein
MLKASTPAPISPRVSAHLRLPLEWSAQATQATRPRRPRPRRPAAVQQPVLPPPGSGASEAASDHHFEQVSHR